MSNVKKVLVVRPDFEQATHILSSVLKKYFVDDASKKAKVEDLYGAEATSLNFHNKLEDEGIKGVLIGGHGDYIVVTGQNYDILWLFGNVDEKEVKGRDILTISCRCGRDLGPYLMDLGANTYKGYKEDFVLAYNGTEPPENDEYAKLFILPAIERGRYLFDSNSTPEQSEEEADKLTEQEIAQWRDINPQIADLLRYDRSIQVFYSQSKGDWRDDNDSIWRKIIRWILKFIRDWLSG
jgi:hypothetical protein